MNERKKATGKLTPGANEIDASASDVELTPASPLPSAENLHDVRSRPFTTVSCHPIGRLYGPRDRAAQYLSRTGHPPFTRGIHPTMYRGRLWTMRQFAGFGAAA